MGSRRRLALVLAGAWLMAGCGTIPGPPIEGGEAGKLPPIPSSSSWLPPPPTSSAEEPEYATAVFDDIQATWEADFSAAGWSLPPATLNLFTGSTDGSCGVQKSEVGPFYCSGDMTVNLDLRFFDYMDQHFGVGNDFGQAYVIAHEYGHHIENVLGITARVALEDRLNPSGANALSVKFELQADCLAGVWAHSVHIGGQLTSADVRAALNTAAVVGDDFIQKLNGGEVEPESWTHGSSAQRQQWLTTGLNSGEAGSCNTYGS